MPPHKILILGLGEIGKAVAVKARRFLPSYGITLQNRPSPNNEHNKKFAEALGARFVEGFSDEDSLVGHDIIIHTAGVKRTMTTASRQDLASANLPLVENILQAERLNPNCPIISVTNPTEIICDFKKALQEIGSCSQVYGTGLNLDNWRLRAVILPALLNVEEADIKGACVVGDHSDPILALKYLKVKGEAKILSDGDRALAEGILKKYSKIRRHVGATDFGSAEAKDGDYIHPANEIVTLIHALTELKISALPVQVPLDASTNYGFEPNIKLPDVGMKAVGHLHLFDRQLETLRSTIYPPQSYLTEAELEKFTKSFEAKSPSVKVAAREYSAIVDDLSAPKEVCGRGK